MPIGVAAYDSCWFCKYLSREVPCAFIVENELAVAFVNHRQYERGAMLVIPRAHRENIVNIHEPELVAVHLLAKQLVTAAVRAFNAVGANVYQNNGTKAGQSIPHLHVHVVPRYEHSDPDKLFLQRDFDVVPMEQQRAIAAAIRAAM